MRDGGGGEGGAGDGGRVRHMSAAVLIAEGNHVNSGLATGPDYPRLTQREVPSHSRKTSSKPKKKSQGQLAALTRFGGGKHMATLSHATSTIHHLRPKAELESKYHLDG